MWVRRGIRPLSQRNVRHWSVAAALTQPGPRSMFTPPHQGWGWKGEAMIALKVTGMTCGHCEMAVKKALSQVPGVKNVVSVDRQKEEAVVEGDAAIPALVAAIEEEGYQAEPRT